MKPLEFNTLDNNLQSDPWKELTRQAQESIKSMQGPVPQVGLPDHVVLPIIEKKESVQYVLALNNEQKGPFTASQLREYLKSGLITDEAYVWTTGWPQWRMIKECPQIITMH